MVQLEAVGMRKTILQAATRLFVSNGYSAISMREIAEACGISKAALYYHFKDKEELLLEIFRDYLRETSRLIDASQSQDGSPRERIEALARAIFAQPPDQRGIIRLAIQEMANIRPAARADFGTLYHDQFIGRINAVLARGVEQGQLRPVDVSLASWIFLGMMYPFFFPGQERALDEEQVIQHVVSIFFEGVKPA